MSDTLRKRFETKFAVAPSGCWEWQKSLNRQGYGTFRLRTGVTRLASRVAWQIYRGDIGDKYVLHHCDNRRCVNPDHLYLGTQKENAADRERRKKHRHDPSCYGETHHWAKLTDVQVRQIRETKGTLKELASRYGMSISQMWNIRSGAQWTQLRTKRKR